MAEVIFLRLGEALPEDGDYIVVGHDLKGRLTIGGMIGRRSLTPSLAEPGSGDPRQAAIAAARELADQRGVATVYVEVRRADF